jgi:hypothetical protein
MQVKNMKLRIFLILLLAFLFLPKLHAWGPVSHIALTYEAGANNEFPVSPDLLGAYLAGSTEPDVGLDDGKSEDYGTYHSENFAKAMEAVAQKKKSPAREILLARAAGFRSHHAGDSAAHGKTGYANAKVMYPGLDTGLPQHTTNELCIDMILYDRNKAALKKQSLNFIDVDTLIEVRKEFTRITGEPLENDRAKLKKELLNHRAMVLTELSLAHHLSSTDQEKLAEMREIYSDLAEGAADGKGSDLAIARIAEQAKPSEDLSGFKTKNTGFKIKDFLNNSVLSKSFQALERGALRFMKSAVIRDNLGNLAESKIDNARNKAFINFGANLLNPKLTFKQAVVLAGKATSDYPENPEQKLAYLEIEAEMLRKQRDEAQRAYQNRPWWKFWLFFSQSDKKKYKALEAKYSEKMAQIQEVRATLPGETEIPASESGFVAAVMQATLVTDQSQHNSDNIADLQAKVEAAYQKMVAAAEAQDPEAIKQAEQELEKAKEALHEASE